jgi:protein XagA
LIRAGRWLGRSTGYAGAIALIVAAPAAALAGAWTLPEGAGLIIESLYGWTGFGPPLGGPAVPQSKVEAQTYVEYGLTDRLTIFGQASLEHYALGHPTSDTYNGLDYSSIGLRAKIWSTGEWVFSGEAMLYAPGAHDATQPAQAGNTGGAGEAGLLAGTNFTILSTPGFVDAQVGYRLRTAGPPDEWHGDFTVGFKFTPRIMLMLQDFTTITNASTNPGFPAWRSSVVEASVVYALDDKWSVQLGFFTSVWTVKTNTEHGAALSVWGRF